MATIPTVPSFVTGETPSIAKLNQLASCVTFIYVAPAFAQLSGSGQSLTNAANTALTWSAPSTDRDAGWAAGHPTRYTAKTPGYYQLDALAAWAANGTGARQAYFQVTTGINNPGGAGQTTVFGAVDALADSSGPTRYTIAALSPYLYGLDYLEVYAYQNSGGALNTAACTWQIVLQSLGP